MTRAAKKPGICRDCGKRPAATAASWYCLACRPGHRRGRRSRLDVIRDADGRFLAGHTSRGGKFSWPPGRGPGIPEGAAE